MSHLTLPRTPRIGSLPLLAGTMAALFAAGLTIATGSASAAPGIALWDTGARLSESLDAVDRTGWKKVPSDLLLLESDPSKASSDPGYYGRDYVFRGDAVVENDRLAAVFSPARGGVAFLTKTDGAAGLGSRWIECQPLGADAARAFGRLELLRNAADEVVIGLLPAGTETAVAPVLFVFGRSEIVEIRPPATTRGLRLAGAIDYGVVPGFVSDDLVFAPAKYPESTFLALPAEGAFLGLMQGGDRELVLTWPQGKQRLSLGLGGRAGGARGVEWVDLETDGKPVYLAPVVATGLWHRQALSPKHLETDVVLAWKRPFPARWKTQLYEGDVRTTFVFHESRGQIWRGVPGSYSYPAWFEGDQAFLRPSKKVPPRDECLVYFVEGQETPAGIHTPVDIVRATLGRAAAETLLDSTGRKLRTHHRRAGDGVRRACTCGCTEVIQAVFEAGEEVDRKGAVRDAIDDMIYFVRRHVERIDEYRVFAAETVRFLDAAAKASPELGEYVNQLKEIVGQIPQECTVQAENMKSPAHAEDLARRTMALTDRKDPGNLKAYMALLKAWRDMGGAQDYVLAQCHAITRRLFQEAGYAAAARPAAIPVGVEVRQRCRQILRNPDGYEIWAEY